MRGGATRFAPGEEFYLDAIVSNPGQPLTHVPLVVLLDLGVGEYWFWPSWRHYPPGMDFSSADIEPGQTRFHILDFVWPRVPGAQGAASFFGALLDAGFSAIIGQIGSYSFEYNLS